jgi:hypothetical protein
MQNGLGFLDRSTKFYKSVQYIQFICTPLLTSTTPRGNAQLRGKYIIQNGGKRSKKIDGKKNIVWLLGLSALQVGVCKWFIQTEPN